MRDGARGRAAVNRRELLLATGAAALVACAGDTTSPTDNGPVPAPDRAPEPDPWSAPGAWDEVAFAWGLLAGDATADAVVLAARTTEPAVDLVVMEAVDGEWVERERRAGLVPEEGSVRIELSGLTPDTAHAWILASTDGSRRSMVGRFRTGLGADGFRKVVIGASSCFASENAGLPGLANAARERLDAFLLLGDTVYADGALEEYRAHWKGVCATPSFRDLAASTSVIATWDDHEVANNWTTGGGDGFNETLITEEQLDTAVLAFHESVPMRLEAGRLWRKVSLGPVVDVFVLDCRGERADGKLVSDEQLAWIVDELGASAAAFKLVMVSIHATDHSALLGWIEDKDRWQGYPAQRDALVAAAEGVPGVLFVTGDMHYGAIQKLSPAGKPGEHLWEVAVGPSGSELFLLKDLVDLAQPEVQAQYPVVLETWNWGRITLDPGLMTATIELVDDGGAVVGTQVVAFA